MGLLGSFILLYFFSYAFANTEIVNFEAQATNSVDYPFTHFWPTLHATSNNLKWNLTAADTEFLHEKICPKLEDWWPNSSEGMKPCPHELWVVLDLDKDGQWERFNKFTLRISWPAFYPTDVSIKIYDPIALASVSSGPPSVSSDAATRHKYARIRLLFSGVLTPPASTMPEKVPIFLILEPLYFGVLPQSVIPTLWAIIAIISLGIPVAMKLNAALQRIVQNARQNASSPDKVK